MYYLITAFPFLRTRPCKLAGPRGGRETDFPSESWTEVESLLGFEPMYSIEKKFDNNDH